jgi:hypothetical protein
VCFDTQQNPVFLVMNENKYFQSCHATLLALLHVPGSNPQLSQTFRQVALIKTSALDYNGERYLSSIINCVIFRL